MGHRTSALLTALVLACTTPAPSVDTIPNATPSAAAVSPTPTADPCPVASLPDRATAAPVLAGPPATGEVAGTLLFEDAGRFTVFSGGSLTEITPPFPPREGLTRLSPDGQELRGLLWDEGGQATYLWRYRRASRATSLVTLPIPRLPTHAAFAWSPDVTRFAYVHDFDAAETEIVIGSLDGTIDRLRVPGERLVASAWRGGSTYTFVTAAGTFGLPKPDATLWSSRPGDARESLGRISLGSTGMQWARGGDALAYVGLDDQGETALRIRMAGVDTIALRTADLLRAPLGCRIAGRELRFSSVEWSPGGASVVVRGQGPGQSLYFAAWLRSSGEPGFFLVPPSCYTFSAEWATSSRLLVPMWGPECGTDDKTNRVAVVDAESAQVLAELPIARKARVTPSPDGRWFATQDDAVLHIVAPSSQLDPGGTERFSIARRGFVQWCCPR